MQQGQLAHLQPLYKLIILFSAVIISGSLSTMMMGVIAEPVFNVDVHSIESMMENVAFMQAYQIIQSISLFVTPSLLAFYLFFRSFRHGINGKAKISGAFIAITVAVIFFGQFFIIYTGWLNHQLQLPESMQNIYNWMVDKEAEAGDLTTIMLQYDNWFQITITILLLSVLPAIGEEWLFRGLLQHELNNIFNNKHIAILITAILFSAIHMQFLTFLPRFFLGIILGYLFVLSGNLWLSVIAHFINNFMAVVVYMFLNNDDTSPLDMSTENPFGVGVILSGLVIIAGLYLINVLSTQKSTQPNSY